MTRRRALGLTAGGAAALAAAATGWRSSRSPGLLSSSLLQRGEPLTQPPALTSAGGLLRAELTAATGIRIAGVDVAGFGYNGLSPGPTLRVHPGDELRLRLTNQLADPTNLHTHGLRVSPQGQGDNPFVHAEPGTSLDYVIRIPGDHPVGTFWYHPHHHGSTADQVFGGLAGALLVVPRDADSEPAVDHDRILTITDTTLRADRTIRPAGRDDRVIGREGDFVLVNGLLQPTIAGTPGTIQRWRVINACASRVFDLHVAGHLMDQIAVDGSYLPAPRSTERVRLSPGNRADVLIQVGRPGSYPVIADPVDRGEMGTNRPSMTPVTLAALTVDGAARSPAPLPPSLPGRAELDLPVTRTRHIDLTMRMGSGRMTFGINDRVYDPARDDHRVRAGDVEEWVLNNNGPLAHPFHLHVWPFLVLDTSDGAPPAGVLQDVLFVPARGWARIRIAFTGPIGRTVFHCHILDHGDDGMMATVNVSPTGR